MGQWNNAERGTLSSTVKVPLSTQERVIIDIIMTLQRLGLVQGQWPQMQNDAVHHQENIVQMATGGMEEQTEETQVTAPRERSG